MKVYVISETPNEAMQHAEAGRFVRAADRHTIVASLRDKVWEVEIEINAISAIKKRTK